MGYLADSFVADEIPTTSKWNKLWNNDASFNDGTGIADDAIIARHVSGFDKSNLTTDSNPYKFRAYRGTSNQSISSTAKIQLNAEDFDTNNNFDSTTNYQYTVPVDGYYMLSGAVTISVGANDIYNAYIYKNGSEAIRGSGLVPGFAFDHIFPVAGLIQLTATDTIDLRARNGSGTAKNVIFTQAGTFLSGFLVSRT